MTTPKSNFPSNLEQRLIELNQYKIDLGLDRLKKVIGRLQLAHNLPQIISIGGTNGKGSTVAALSGLLRSQGKSFGAFTSPHIFNFNERINISGEPASDEEILCALTAIDDAKKDLELSYFEYAFLAAVMLFKQHEVDVMLLEVGLGGRLDAVNTLDADACVITSVDLDHTEWLGDNIEAIATEKAGIMRPNKPVVYGDLSTPSSIKSHAKSINSHLLQYEKDYQITIKTETFDYQFGDNLYKNLPHPQLKGDWQFLNFGSALTVLLTLGYEFEETQLQNVLRTWQLIGRLHTTQTHPWVLADVAHNRQSAQQLALFLKTNPVKGVTRAVFSVLTDKDPASWLGALNDVIDHWFVFELAGTRGMSMSDLITQLANHVTLFSAFDSGPEAFDAALGCSASEDRVLVFGSFHVLEVVFNPQSLKLRTNED